MTSPVKANAGGIYSIPFVLPGKYTGIVVQINDRIALDFTPEVGATSDSITVTAETPMLQTASADMGQVVERKMIDRLPMSSMNPMTAFQVLPSDYAISLEPPRYSWLRGPRGTYTSMIGYRTFGITDNPATFGTIASAGGTPNVNISGKLRF